MAIDQQKNLGQYCSEMARAAHRASQQLAQLNGDVKNRWLHESARRLRQSTERILAANQRDVQNAPDYGLSDAQIDRLRLTPERLAGIADGLEQVASLPDPIGTVMDSTVRPNGLKIHKVRVPLGVVFFIYESRPNVTADAAAICVKSGNAVILRGGKEALYSSQILVDILNEVGQEVGVPADAVQLVGTTDRDAVGHFLKLDRWISVAIPRGGEGLIRRVTEEARMPVIKHYHGNCHVYVDRDADLQMALAILINSKCQRMGVCNAAESLVVHREIAEAFLPLAGEALRTAGVEVRGDRRVCSILPDAAAATEEDYATEYLGPVLSAVVVDSLDDAIIHINRYGSGHTDTIVTNHLQAAERFTAGVDSSAVMVNASTRFNDGGEFGLGAEIGISTDKFHARGPCGLVELTSYKYVVFGRGQIRGG